MCRSKTTNRLIFALVTLFGLSAASLTFLWLEHHKTIRLLRASGVEQGPEAEALGEGLRASVEAGDWEAANELERRLAAAGPRAVPILRSILLAPFLARHEDLLLAQRAAWILGQIGTREAVHVLLEAMESQRSDSVRGQLVLALSCIHGAAGSQSLAKLEEVLRDVNETPELRRSAALLLAKRSECKATEFLVAEVRGRADPQAVRWALEALGFSTCAREVSRLLRELALQEPDESIRALAVRALGRAEREQALEVLRTVLQFDRSSLARQEAVGSISEMENTPDVASLLSQALSVEPQPGIRALAATALGRPGQSAHLAVLQGAVTSEKSLYVRLKIVEAMGQVGGKDAETLLERLAASELPTAVCGRARAALQRLRGEPTPQLNPHPLDQDEPVELEESNF